MRGIWKNQWGVVALTGVLAAGAVGYPVAAAVAPAAGVQLSQGEVSSTPATGTPALQYKGAQERIRQLAICGGNIYAVGGFGSIVQNGQTLTRQNVFSFKATAPYTMTSWAPAVNGIVNSIAFDGTNCGDAYIGGLFTTVNGTSAHNLAEVSTSTGDVVTAFGHSTNNQVETLAYNKGHLLIGGYFTYVNGSNNSPYFTSVSPVTGKYDGFLKLAISGHYHYCLGSECTTGSSSSVYNQQISNSRTLDLVEGTFTSVGGQPRQQIFMLNLATDPATVTGWTSPQWDGSEGNLPKGYPYQCGLKEGFYIRAATWSPDDQTIYIADTGHYPYQLPGHGTRTGLCDASAAFPATQAKVLDKWITYTGCYSLYSVAANNSAIYVAGHPKYAYNPNGCKASAPGAVPDSGMAGLSTSTGKPLLKKDGKPLYTMSRANADDMLLTGKGLWIASSNRFGSQYCGLKPGHAGICYLPYP